MTKLPVITVPDHFYAASPAIVRQVAIAITTGHMYMTILLGIIVVQIPNNALKCDLFMNSLVT